MAPVKAARLGPYDAIGTVAPWAWHHTVWPSSNGLQWWSPLDANQK